MKNKILLLLVATVVAVSLGLVGGGCEPAAPTIVIGMSRSETGPLAQIHELAFLPVYDTYLEEVNTTGLTVGAENYQVEVDVRNDGSVMANMLSNTAAILNDIAAGDVHFLFGPTCTAFLEGQAPLAANASVVQMTVEGGATTLIPKLNDYDYSFINLSFSDWYQIPVLAKLLAEAQSVAHPGTNATAYIGYQNDAHGLEYEGVAKTYFANEGIIVKGSFPMDSGDLTANTELIKAANQSGANVLCAFAYPEHTFGTALVAAGLNYTPDAIVIGPGANFNVYSIINNGTEEGVTCFAVANHDTSTAMDALYNKLEADPEVGWPNVDVWGHPLYWAAMQIWEEAAVACGTVDPATKEYVINQDTYRNYLRNGNFTTVLGATWYVDGSLTHPAPATGGALMNYKCHTGEIGQWQKGIIEIVGYAGIGNATDPYGLTNYVVTANYTFPK